MSKTSVSTFAGLLFLFLFLGMFGHHTAAAKKTDSAEECLLLVVKSGKIPRGFKQSISSEVERAVRQIDPNLTVDNTSLSISHWWLEQPVGKQPFITGHARLNFATGGNPKAKIHMRVFLKDSWRSQNYVASRAEVTLLWDGTITNHIKDGISSTIGNSFRGDTDQFAVVPITIVSYEIQRKEENDKDVHFIEGEFIVGAGTRLLCRLDPTWNRAAREWDPGIVTCQPI